MILIINYNKHYYYFVDPNIELTLDAKLGYRNIGDKDDDWKLYAESVEKRYLDCHAVEVNHLYFSIIFLNCNNYLNVGFYFRK